MRILFACDSLFADLSKNIIAKNLNARVLKLSIPGSSVQEIGLATVNRVMNMNPKPDLLLVSAGTNDARNPIELFIKNTLKIKNFCINKDILFCMVPIPYSRYTPNEKIDEMNNFINKNSCYRFDLNYKTKDLASDGLHLKDSCLLIKIEKIKSILNLAIGNLIDNRYM